MLSSTSQWMLRRAHAALTTGYFKLVLMVITAAARIPCKHLQHVFLFSSLIVLKPQLLAVCDSRYRCDKIYTLG